MPTRERTYAAAGVSLATADAVVTATPRRRRVDPHRRRRGLVRRLRRALRARRAAPARGVDRLGRLEARPRPPARGSSAGAAPTSPRTASTTSSRPAPSRSSSSTTSPQGRSTPSRSPSSSRERPRSAVRRAARSSAARPPSSRAIYREDELDFCGTVVGLVDRDELIDGSRAAAGDVVVGLASAGSTRTASRSSARIVGDEPFDADLLLPPTRCYLDDVRALRARADVRALAHVTGGGIAGNLARVLPDGVGAVVDPEAWERPPVFALARRRGRPRGRAAAGLQPRDRLLRRRASRDRLPDDRVIGRLEAGSTAWNGPTRDRRPRERGGNEPPGADRRQAADRRGRVEPAGCQGARARGRGRHPDRGLRRRRVPGPRGARRGARGLAPRARASSSSSSRATCTCCGRASSRSSGGRS